MLCSSKLNTVVYGSRGMESEVCFLSRPHEVAYESPDHVRVHPCGRKVPLVMQLQPVRAFLYQHYGQASSSRNFSPNPTSGPQQDECGVDFPWAPGQDSEVTGLSR